MATIGIERHEISSSTHQLFNVTFFGNSILTTLTNTASVVDQWISDILRIHSRRIRSLIVGLDVEWRPNFIKNVENPAALLQLCVGRRVLIFQLIHADAIPKSLIDFLANPGYSFVGVGIGPDAEKLLGDYEIGVSRQVDLRTLAAEKFQNLDLKKAGLKTLALTVLGVDVKKPKRVTMSRWDSAWLRWDQVQYAAVDAYLSFEIGKRLLIDAN